MNRISLNMNFERIFYKLSTFKNTKYDYSNCEVIFIPLDKIVLDSYEELFNQELNLFDIKEINDLRLKMNNNLYRSYLLAKDLVN